MDGKKWKRKRSILYVNLKCFFIIMICFLRNHKYAKWPLWIIQNIEYKWNIHHFMCNRCYFWHNCNFGIPNECNTVQHLRYMFVWTRIENDLFYLIKSWNSNHWHEYQFQWNIYLTVSKLASLWCFIQNRLRRILLKKIQTILSIFFERGHIDCYAIINCTFELPYFRECDIKMNMDVDNNDGFPCELRNSIHFIDF